MPRNTIPVSSLFPIDEQAALNQVVELMRIPGKSCQEGKISARIREALLAAGLPGESILVDQVNRKSPAGGEVGNLIVKLPGTIRAPRRLLMAHIDTVPLCVGCEPIVDGPVVRSANPKTGLGADDRAGASVLLFALLEILMRKLPHPPLTFFWPVQEEIGLYGARFVELSKLGNPKLCFNWDGGGPESVCIGATGDYALDVHITGKASHAGVAPEKGINAIAIAAHAIARLNQEGWHGKIVKGKKTGTSNIGVIQAGEATNVVTPELSLRGEVRSHDPVFRTRLVREFEKAFQAALKEVKNDVGEKGKIDFQSELKYESFRLKEEEPSVVEALRACQAAGLTPFTRISNGGLDANWLSSRGLPTVTLGCGQQDVHTVNETLHIGSYLAACRIGLILATMGE